MKIGSETWNDLCDKKISGFRAFVTGKLEFEGRLAELKKWNTEVVDKYLNHVDVSSLRGLN